MSELLREFGLSGTDDDDVSGADDVSDIAGAADEITDAVMGEGFTDVGRAYSRAQTLVARRSRRPRTRLKLLSAVQPRLALRIDQYIAEARARARGEAQGKDDVGGNNFAYLDSGETEVLADAVSGPYTIQFSAPWEYIGLVVSETVANNFVITDFKIGGVPAVGLGTTVTGNGTGSGGSLAPFVPGYFGRGVMPTFGRKYGSGARYELTVKNLGTAARFTAAVIYRMDWKALSAGMAA